MCEPNRMCKVTGIRCFLDKECRGTRDSLNRKTLKILSEVSVSGYYHLSIVSESNIASIYLSPCLHFGSNQNGREDFTEKKRNLAFQKLSARPIDTKKYMNYIEDKEIFHDLKLHCEAQRKAIHPLP